MGLIEWYIKRKLSKLEKENKMFNWLKGKKTYGILAITAILGAIGALNQSGATNIQIPEIVFTVLGALGWYTNSKRTSK